MPTPSFDKVLLRVGTEWRESARLRFGVYLLLSIFWFYGILVLKDLAIAQRASWEEMELKIARARATAATADWSTRAQEMQAAVVDLETLLWREGSVGLSQASFEERISQSLSKSGVTLRSIRTSVASDGTGNAGQLGLIELRARVQTDFRAATLYPWLSATARKKFEKASTIFVESLIIRGASFGQPAMAEMELVGYAIKAAIGPGREETINPAAGVQK
jgi:hypothetical protein